VDQSFRHKRHVAKDLSVGADVILRAARKSELFVLRNETRISRLDTFSSSVFHLCSIRGFDSYELMSDDAHCIVATIYECLGIDAEMPLYDLGAAPNRQPRGGRPIHEIPA